MPPPYSLFKYVTAERIDILQRLKIRFSQPKALNDPFETQPAIVGLIEEAQMYTSEMTAMYEASLKKEFDISPHRHVMSFADFRELVKSKEPMILRKTWEVSNSIMPSLDLLQK